MNARQHFGLPVAQRLGNDYSIISKFFESICNLICRHFFLFWVCKECLALALQAFKEENIIKPYCMCFIVLQGYQPGMRRV